MTGQKLTLLGLLQSMTLIMGISLIACVAPDLHESPYWLKVIVGGTGLALLLAGLSTRDWIRVETTGKKS